MTFEDCFGVSVIRAAASDSALVIEDCFHSLDCDVVLFWEAVDIS